MHMDALDKWIKTNIQRKAVKKQKDRAPLLQAVVRQRRPYYPYTLIYTDPYYTALHPRVVVIARDSNPNCLFRLLVIQ